MEVKSMLTRLLDYLKTNQITTLITDLSSYEEAKKTEIGITSLADTWLRLENVEKNNEQIRMVRIIKSRGMNHSSAINEFIITNKGIEINEKK